ncbi:MAG: adenosylcobinamide-GDP ribazoletransferase [Tissierellia bacterium]|nr:adenosylcobinamide-GDP ribazoletransferase [Tissierellia bacterium]
MIKSLILSLQFLTRIPIPIKIPFEDKFLRKSIFFFPWIGLFIGVLLGFIGKFLPKGTVYGLIVTIFWVGITGAMHLDGVADTFDGFFSGKSRERILEIMKDSRTGSFGVIALLFVIVGKILMLSYISPSSPLFLGIICSGARLGNGFVISLFPGARPGGMGELFRRTKPFPYILVSASLYFIFLLLSNPEYLWIVTGEILFIFSFSFYSKYKIGGVTGDIYGANVEMGELFGLLLWGLFL